MPELPDIAAYISALEPRIVGRVLERVRIANVFCCARPIRRFPRSTDEPFVRSGASGKRIAIGLDDELWIVHAASDDRRTSALARASGSVTQADATMLAAFDFCRRHARPHGGRNETSRFNPSLSGAKTLSTRAGSRRHRRASRRTLPAFRQALTVENRTLKRALTDPRFLSGIGNAYSDEILHAAQLSPIALTHKLKDGGLAALVRPRRKRNAPPYGSIACADETEATGFPKRRHGVSQTTWPCTGDSVRRARRCGETVQRIRYADNETNYCARCQTGGTLLADRSLSRLLKADWPRTLDELDALKRR